MTKFRPLHVLLLFAILAGFAGMLYATSALTWSQTAFLPTDGTYSNTESVNNQEDIRLSSLGYLGTGRDGDITISANRNINTQAIATGRTVADGWATRVTSLSSNSATLSDTPPANTFFIGDEIMMISLKGTPTAYANVGNYEFLRVLAVASNVVTFVSNKTRYYGEGASDDVNVGTTQFVMLQRVPNYQNVTISANWLYPSPWNGTLYGVMAFRCAGTFTISGGGVTVDTYGFYGGTGQYASNYAPSGESYFSSSINSGGYANATNGYAGLNQTPG